MASPEPTPLEAELEAAVLDAMAGDPWGPALQGRIETVLKGLLFRHGIRGARVVVWNPGDGVHVQVQLPRGAPRVRQLVFHMG